MNGNLILHFKITFQVCLMYQVLKIFSQSMFLDTSALGQIDLNQDETCSGDWLKIWHRIMNLHFGFIIISF